MTRGPALPRLAALPLNRCNLPAAILGSLRFQEEPVALAIDGVRELHGDLFARLNGLGDRNQRAQLFLDYMTVHFLLHRPEEAGLDAQTPTNREKADYLRVLRGWFFDADGQEAAVLKGWVESRFGLPPRHHGTPLANQAGNQAEAAYQGYLAQRSRGLYNTNALEAQLDLLYHFCQYELARRGPGVGHLTLYRGTNAFAPEDILEGTATRPGVVLFNNVNSFSSDPNRAGEFGDCVVSAAVPLAKIFCFADLLPGRLRGEDEFIVIGGLYQVKRLQI